MKTKLLIIFIFSFAAAFGQTKENKSPCDSLGEIFTITEVMPTFPGKQKALDAFISENKRECDKSGTVFVTFVVDTAGLIKCTKILRGISYYCDTEALRLLTIMPKWNNATQNGKPVNCQYNLPVKF